MLMEQRLEHMCERVWSNSVSNNNNPNPFLTCLGIYRFSPHLLVHTCRHLLKILREGSSGKQRCGSGNTPHKWCQHTVDFETWPNMTKSLAVPLTYWRASALFCTTEGLRTEKLVKQKKKKKEKEIWHIILFLKKNSEDYLACVKIAESYLVEVRFFHPTLKHFCSLEFQATADVFFRAANFSVNDVFNSNFHRIY